MNYCRVHIPKYCHNFGNPSKKYKLDNQKDRLYNLEGMQQKTDYSGICDTGRYQVHILIHCHNSGR